MPDLIKRDGGVLHFEMFGDAAAPAIVLIEGLGAHMLGWRTELCQMFVERGFRVVRFDNRDVGLSTHYEGHSYGIGDMAEDVHELIAHLDASSTHVVGQSMGGIIAQHLVVAHPEDVTSLALLYTAADTTHVLGSDRDAETLANLAHAMTREEAMDVHIAVERACASTAYSFDEKWKRDLGGLMWDRAYDPAGVVRQREAIDRVSVGLDQLADVKVPTLLVHGTADAIIDHRASEDLHGAIANSELWLVNGMGHDLPREIWPQLVEAIVANATKAMDARLIAAANNSEAS